jgi:hypothetical protein
LVSPLGGAADASCADEKEAAQVIQCLPMALAATRNPVRRIRLVPLEGQLFLYFFYNYRIFQVLGSSAPQQSRNSENLNGHK